MSILNMQPAFGFFAPTPRALPFTQTLPSPRATMETLNFQRKHSRRKRAKGGKRNRDMNMKPFMADSAEDYSAYEFSGYIFLFSSTP